MKKIFLLLIFLLIPSFTNALEQIDIETSSRLIEFGDTFTVTITLKDLNIQQGGGQVSLPGIENFDVFSQSTESQLQNINGETQSITRLSITLQARDTGEFELGPVSIIGDEILEDNEKLNIIVASNDLNSSTPMRQDNQAPGMYEDEIVEQLEKQSDSQLLGGLREVKISLWTHIAILLFFIISFYLLLKYIFSVEKIDVTDIKKVPDQIDMKQQYKIYFKTLSGEIGTISSEDFFHQFNVGMRKIFGDMGVKNHRSATLRDLNDDKILQGTERIDLFKKSYRHEYSGVAVGDITQKKYVEDILTLLDR